MDKANKEMCTGIDVAADAEMSHVLSLAVSVTANLRKQAGETQCDNSPLYATEKVPRAACVSLVIGLNCVYFCVCKSLCLYVCTP